MLYNHTAVFFWITQFLALPFGWGLALPEFFFFFLAKGGSTTWTRTECSGPNGVNDPYSLGPGVKHLQPLRWQKQCRLKEAKPEDSVYSSSVGHKGAGKP